jgi:hypothetical protein
MSESVQRDDQWSLHDMVYFRYDDQRSSLPADGLMKVAVQATASNLNISNRVIQNLFFVFGFVKDTTS